jgi:uncharacterized membrane protein HdeD (DUF308 family)
MAQAIPRAANELWWAGVAEGVVALLFGIAAVFWPGLTLVTLVYLFSAFVLAWGIVSIVHGILAIKQRGTWWLTLLFGIVATGVGVYLVRHTNVSFKTLILLIGFTLIIRGIFDVLSVFLEAASATTKVLWGISGLAAIIVGIVILNQPVAGGVAFVWVLGLYALITGPLLIAMSIDVRNELNALSNGSSRK